MNKGDQLLQLCALFGNGLLQPLHFRPADVVFCDVSPQIGEVNLGARQLGSDAKVIDRQANDGCDFDFLTRSFGPAAGEPEIH